MTPMLLVMVAIGGTDVLFALDSIPAIFGLTQSVFIVFTATAFSLLGLRQLYFLIDGLLDRLIYLSYGLAAIPALIGVKLILHALHENNLSFINDARPIHVPEISTGAPLSVIAGVLTVTVIASLAGVSSSPRGRSTMPAVSRQRVEDRPRRRLTPGKVRGGQPSTEDRTTSHHEPSPAAPSKSPSPAREPPTRHRHPSIHQPQQISTQSSETTCPQLEVLRGPREPAPHGTRFGTRRSGGEAQPGRGREEVHLVGLRG
jgi:hypothetical protein